jgi:cobalt-zinc-cadmium efflux system outer membrane protein
MRYLLSAVILSTSLISDLGYAQDILTTNTFAAMATENATPASSNEPETKKQSILSVTGGINLQTAISRALQNSPRIKSADAAVLATKGVRSQSDVWLNPEISVQAENVAGSGRYSGIKSAEITYGVSQIIEIGGKRSGRKAVAEQNVALSRHDQMLIRINVVRDVTVAYVNAVAAQEMLKLAEEQKKIAADLYKEVNERVDSAREPIIQKSKAHIALSTAKFVYEHDGRELDYTKRVLSNMWGIYDNHFSLDTSAFFLVSLPMTKAKAEAKMHRNPSYKRMESNCMKMQAQYGLEKSNAIPDPRINLGVRNLRDTGNRAFILGISIPIPIFNFNQGNVERARQEVSKAESDKQVIKLAIINELYEVLKNQLNAYRNVNTLKKSIIPSAEQAFILARQGYRSGKFPYLEVLDAQRTLFELKKQYIVVLREYHIAKAEIDKLTVSET